MITEEKLKSIFSVFNYHDLWKENGAVENQIEKNDVQSLTDAKDHFRHSLGLRKRQAEGREFDEGHQKMTKGLNLCVKKIDQILKCIETEKQMNKSSLHLEIRRNRNKHHSTKYICCSHVVSD